MGLEPQRVEAPWISRCPTVRKSSRQDPAAPHQPASFRWPACKLPLFQFTSSSAASASCSCRRWCSAHSCCCRRRSSSFARQPPPRPPAPPHRCRGPLCCGPWLWDWLTGPPPRPPAGTPPPRCCCCSRCRSSCAVSGSGSSTACGGGQGLCGVRVRPAAQLLMLVCAFQQQPCRQGSPARQVGLSTHRHRQRCRNTGFSQNPAYL